MDDYEYESEAADCRHEARRERRINNALINHPHSNDPDHPGFDICVDCHEDLDDCECDPEY
tara:strand:- start:6 stop:188 length:183 start_codon:yes stop_codon:yes gene_type:complete